MTVLVLGPVVFDLVLNVQGIESTAEVPFAKHDVVGAAPVYEDMGEGEGSISIEAVVHPEHFGGIDRLAVLEMARAQRIPLPLMRGNLTPVGWVLVQSVSQQEAEISAAGHGLDIAVSISCLRVGPPGAGAAQSIFRLFL